MNVLVDALVAAALVKGRPPRLGKEGERSSFAITLDEYVLLQTLAMRALERHESSPLISAIETATTRRIGRSHWVAALLDLDACSDYGNTVDLVSPTRAAAAHVALLARAYSITHREAVNVLTAESLGMTFCATSALLSRTMQVALEERNVPLALIT